MGVDDKDSERLLGEIHGQMTQFFERYDSDRKETTARYQAEREERKAWRDGIDARFNRVEKKIEPVVRDHQIAVGAGKWIVGIVASGFGAVKGWLFLKDHFR